MVKWGRWYERKMVKKNQVLQYTIQAATGFQKSYWVVKI